MYQQLLAKLLHWANSYPPVFSREFYALKDRLCRKYARFAGHELQEIRKECWGEKTWDREYGGYDYHKCKGKSCRACGGTGIFDIRWVRLERWEWCGFVFHRPDGDTRIPPEVGSVKIFGRIEHKDYGRLSSEAALWLYLLTGEWKLFCRAMRSSRCCGRFWYPLLNLQKVTMELSMRLRRQRCSCGKTFWTWGSGWQICKKCRAPSVFEDIPF